jgi:hypothetical protein
MALVYTRAQVRALVTRRTRLVNHLNAHGTSDLNIDLDDAYRDMRLLVTQSKWATFLKVVTGNLPTAPVLPLAETYVTIPVPTNALVVRKLEVRYGTDPRNDEWDPVPEVSLETFRQSEGAKVWTLIDSGTNATEVANTGSAVAGVIGFKPIPTFGTYQMHYLAEFPGTSADSGAGGFYTYANENQRDLHVYLTAEKLLISDNDSEGMLKGVRDKLADLTAVLVSSAPTHTGPKTWRRSRRYRG